VDISEQMRATPAKAKAIDAIAANTATACRGSMRGNFIRRA
jgi:hypothetical protein